MRLTEPPQKSPYELPVPVIAPSIPYADPVTAFGITYDEDLKTGQSTITVPASVRGVYRAVEAIIPFALVIYALGMTATIVGGMVSWFRRGSPPIMTQIANVGFLLFIGGAAYIAVRAWVREGKVGSWIELTTDALRIHALDLSGSPRRWCIARNRIVEIKPGPVPWNASEKVSMGLHIRITGSETMEVLPGHDRLVAEWLAAVLSDALKRNPLEAPGEEKH